MQDSKKGCAGLYQALKFRYGPSYWEGTTEPPPAQAWKGGQALSEVLWPHWGHIPQVGEHGYQPHQPPSRAQNSSLLPYSPTLDGWCLPKTSLRAGHLKMTPAPILPTFPMLMQLYQLGLLGWGNSQGGPQSKGRPFLWGWIVQMIQLQTKPYRTLKRGPLLLECVLSPFLFPTVCSWSENAVINWHVCKEPRTKDSTHHPHLCK